MYCRPLSSRGIVPSQDRSVESSDISYLRSSPAELAHSKPSVVHPQNALLVSDGTMFLKRFLGNHEMSPATVSARGSAAGSVQDGVASMRLGCSEPCSQTGRLLNQQAQRCILAYLSISTVPTYCAKYQFFTSGEYFKFCAPRYWLQGVTGQSHHFCGQSELQIQNRYLQATWSPPPPHTHLHLPIRCYIHTGAKVGILSSTALAPCPFRLLAASLLARGPLAPCAHMSGTVLVQYYSGVPGSSHTPPPAQTPPTPLVRGAMGPICRHHRSLLLPSGPLLLLRDDPSWGALKGFLAPTRQPRCRPSRTSREPLPHLAPGPQFVRLPPYASRSMSPRIPFQALEPTRHSPSHGQAPARVARPRPCQHSKGPPLRPVTSSLSGITTKA